MRYDTMLRTAFATMAMLSISVPPLRAQALTGAAKWADSARREIDAAALAGDMNRLAETRTLLDRALATFPEDPMLLHYQGYAIYRMINIASAGGSSADVSGYLKLSQDYLERSIAKRPIAESYVLLTSIYGREIGADPSQAQTLGMEIQRVSAEAAQLGPNNPRVSLVQGMGALFTPPEWGGGPAAAEKLFLKSAEQFATDHPVAPAPSWGRGEVYAWLGMVYERTGRKTEAMTAYRKALDAEPNYPWVSRVLIPALEKKER
ncbi:MAG: tetratricopeptide repeat protein [bacterium]